jgi:hypothetical protein
VMWRSAGSIISEMDEFDDQSFFTTETRRHGENPSCSSGRSSHRRDARH